MSRVTQLARDIAVKTRLVIAAWSRQAGQWLTAPRDPITWEALRAKLAARPLPSTYAGRLAALGIVLLLLLPLWLWYAEERPDQKTGVVTYPHASLTNPILGGLGALVLIYAAIRQARTASRRHEEQTEADRQRRITESCSRAVDQLANKEIEVRVGGIYTLGLVSYESPDFYWTVIETLTAFVRERARWTEPEEAGEQPPVSRPRSDIAAALSVIIRRSRKEEGREIDQWWRIDLSGTNLKGADLLTGASSSQDTDPRGANFIGANFSSAHLEGANLMKANLLHADFTGAHLQKANLWFANLENATLTNADLEGTILYDARLQEARLEGARFKRTKLGGTHLDGVDLRSAILKDVDLSKAIGDAKTRLPEGYPRPPHWPPEER
jgi:hypothetical protein